MKTQVLALLLSAAVTLSSVVDEWCPSDGEEWCRSLFFGGPPSSPPLEASTLAWNATPALASVFDSVPELLDGLMNVTSSPAASVVVVQGGQVMYFSGRGSVTADGSGGAPTLDTGYRIASITKVFTSFMLHQLRDLGLVSVEDPVRSLIPIFSKLDDRAASLFGTSRPINLASLAMHASSQPLSTLALSGLLHHVLRETTHHTKHTA